MREAATTQGPGPAGTVRFFVDGSTTVGVTGTLIASDFRGNVLGSFAFSSNGQGNPFDIPVDVPMSFVGAFGYTSVFATLPPNRTGQLFGFASPN